MITAMMTMISLINRISNIRRNEIVVRVSDLMVLITLSMVRENDQLVASILQTKPEGLGKEHKLQQVR